MKTINKLSGIKTKKARATSARNLMMRRPAREPLHGHLPFSPYNANEFSRAKNRFLEATVQEFTTPLNKIILTSDLIGKYYDALSKQSILNEVTAIKTAATYLSAIVNDFLSAQNIDKHNVQLAMASFDLKNLTEIVVGQMKQQTREWQDIKYMHNGASSHVSLDKKLLEHCLINLISNAIKYSDVADHIEVGSDINGDTCRIWVKDYGIGVPEDDKERLFEPFFRASNASHIEGTGLGLNLVKRYTELMGGKVSVEKNGQRGTVFTLIFPVTPWHRRNGHLRDTDH